MDTEAFRQAGHALVDWIARYREALVAEQFPVQSTLKPGAVLAQLPEQPPEQPESFEQVMADVERIVLPGITHWQHPNFYGYFPSGGSLSSVLADMLSTGLAVVGLNWQSSPALTEVEQATTDWIRDLLGLPGTFSGVIQDTASAGTFVAMVCARERASQYAAARAGLQDGAAPLIVYVSEQAHSSVEKGALLAGFGRAHVRAIGLDGHYRLAVDELRQAIEADRAAGLRPCAVVATSGTTATTAFDPVAPIAALARLHGLWLHIDAAMGGSAMLLPEYRELWQGIDEADSIVVNPHKWMGVAADCSLYYVRDSEHLVRVMSTSPSYLRSDVDELVRNYRDWGVPLGRRFRALKLWFALRLLGVEAMRDKLRADIDNARWLAAQAEKTAHWAVIAPVTLQTVCLRHEPVGMESEALDRHTRRWAQAVNDGGRAFVTPALVAGQWLVRVSIGSEYASRDALRDAWQVFQAAAERSACER